VAVALLTPENAAGPGSIGLTGLTDSQVASKVLARGMSTTYPLCCVAMELAAQLERRNLDLELEWIPRGANAEADKLADGCTQGFSTELRRGTTLDALPWLVLPGLLEAGAAFHAASSRPPASGPDSAAKRPRLAGDRLRDREPW